MASLSDPQPDWIETLAFSQHESRERTRLSSQGWIDALSGPARFVEGMPFASRNSSGPAENECDAFEEALPDEPAIAAPEPVEEAYLKGVAEGREAAEQAFDDEKEHRRKLHLSLGALDHAGMDTLASELAETVRQLCAQVIADYTPDPERLLERCHAAAKALGSATDGCALHLNPLDLELIEPGSLAQWRVVEDTAVERGGLRFEGPDGGASDGPEDWRRAIAAALRV